MFICVMRHNLSGKNECKANSIYSNPIPGEQALCTLLFGFAQNRADSQVDTSRVSCKHRDTFRSSCDGFKRVDICSGT